MNINRHNYETFFLLYVDKELSVSEQKAVEQFVMENPDLDPELQLLTKTALQTELVGFNTKSQLYKYESGKGISPELLLFYLDNELDFVTTKKVGDVISSDSSIKKEWEIIRLTKLIANENNIFKGKQILYRHEINHFIKNRFWRIAVAAAILIVWLFTGISIMRKSGPAKVTIAIKTDKTPTRIQLKNIQKLNNNASDSFETKAPGNIVSIKEIKNVNIIPISVFRSNAIHDKNIAISNGKLLKAKKNISQKPFFKNIGMQKRNEIVTSAVLDKRDVTFLKNRPHVEIVTVSIKNKITVPEFSISDYNSVPAMPDSYTKTAVLTDAGSENNNKIFYINEEDLVRSKIGGLFRRVKRVIERNTNIKTSNGIKIAGFGIGIK